MDKQHKLVDVDGAVIAIGAQVKDFRGDAWVVTDWRAPQHEGSSGRVYLRGEGGQGEREFFPGVINAKIVPLA